METNESGNTTIQSLGDTTKAVLRGKMIAIKAYFKKKNPNEQPNLLEKENPKPVEINIRAEIDED